MMPVNFKGTNADLLKSPGLPEERAEILGAPALVGVDRDSGGEFTFIIFAFKPNMDDLKAIAAGEPVYIKIDCPVDSIFPFKLFTLNENGEPNF